MLANLLQIEMRLDDLVWGTHETERPLDYIKLLKQMQNIVPAC